MEFTIRPSNSARRSPQPIKSESIARFRLLRSVSALVASSSLFPCSAVSQLPTRTPSRRTPFTRRMPAASSGLSSPESAASYAIRRTAARRKLIVEGAYCFCSRLILYRRTTVRLNAKRGSEQYHSTNSVIAWSYVRWPLFEVRVFRTADLACSRSGKASTRLGVFLFFRDFDIGDG